MPEQEWWRMSKKQLLVVEALDNGGAIWFSAGQPYLRCLQLGVMKSSPLNSKTFQALKDHDVITEGSDRQWRLKA